MKKIIFILFTLLTYIFCYPQNKYDSSCYTEKFIVVNDRDDESKIFSAGTTTNPPYYKGGMLSWKKFLEQNVQFDEIIKLVPDSMTIFIDSVFLKFIVSRTGRLSNIEIVRSGKQATEKEAIRLLKLSCVLWTPPIVSSGRPVNAWHIEKLAFIVERHNECITTRIGIMR